MNAITLLTFIAVIIAYQSSPGSTFSAQDLVAHHIAKRQTAGNYQADLLQAIAECSAITIEYQCGPSGYAQQTVNIALGCRNESYSHNTANTCARSENGETCGAAAIKLSVNDTDQVNAASCFGAVASGSCPSTCRRFLESASSKLGCCINTYINTTDSPLLALYSDEFDYHLWSLCDVPLPATDCENALRLDPPQNVQECTLQELVSLIVDYQCMPSVGQPLVNALLQNNRCNIFATALVDVCATNANGRTCAEAIGLDLLGSTSTDPLLESLSSNCAGLVDTCSPSCHSAITNIADTYGCCVNIYNSTETGVQLPSLSYSVWNSCGVDSPGVCNSSLTTSPTVLSPTTDPLPTSNNPTTTSTVQTSMDTSEEITNQDPASISPSTLGFDSSTSDSRVLAPVNWIIAMAGLLHLKKHF